MYGFKVKLIDENTGAELTGADQKGVVAIEGPLPPGCMQTVWQDDARFVKTYWTTVAGQHFYNTFDWGIRDADGYYFILGRTDDVINVAGHRLGTREIEESISSHANVAEVAVVGVADQLKGQVAMAFVIARDTAGLSDGPALLKFEGEIMKLVDSQLGAVARPARVHVVTALPKTRSGKLLRRTLQALCEGRDAGDLSTIEDPSALQQIRDLVGQRLAPERGRPRGRWRCTTRLATLRPMSTKECDMALTRRLFMGGLASWALPSIATPALMLARDAKLDIDPAGYLVSEKFDGVRAVWDGRTLRFRSGLPVNAPDWFLARLPGAARWTVSCGWNAASSKS